VPEMSYSWCTLVPWALGCGCLNRSGPRRAAGREKPGLAAEFGDLGQRVIDVGVAERHHLRAEGREIASRSPLILSGITTSIRYP